MLAVENISGEGRIFLRQMAGLVLCLAFLGSFAGCEDYRICPDYLDICPGIGCVDLQTDANHCGSCDKACGEGEACSAGRCVGVSHDADGDGYDSEQWGGSDCDDHDALVNPGAYETCDGRDNDCDGSTDELPDAAAYCDDGNECTDDECTAGVCLNADLNGVTCDDGDDCSMNDSCAGGECSGQPLDADGDGYVSAACGGDDCDDESAEVNPGVEEDKVPGGPLCSDGIDNDCDGLTDEEETGDCTGSECGQRGCAEQTAFCGECGEGYWCIEGKCQEIGDEVVWVFIAGGEFTMGSDVAFPLARPAHAVTVPSFYMTKSEVTVAQYRRCVEAGACTEPDEDCDSMSSESNWGVAGRDNHPVNCVNWNQATDYCGWIGGRLPSEAEWEYAARGGGRDILYPWGDEFATCERAVMYETCHAGDCCPAGCTDNDGDGYGMGSGCQGQDCDDSNPACQSGECCFDCIDVDGDGYGIGPACLGPDEDDGDYSCQNYCLLGDDDKDYDGYGRGQMPKQDCDNTDPDCWEGECCLRCIDIDGDYYGLGEDCLGPDCWEGEPYPLLSGIEDEYGCHRRSTWPVCSKPRGNTLQGLCDMAGNVSECIQDFFHFTYDGAPIDGSAWEEQCHNHLACQEHVSRGGGFLFTHNLLRVTWRLIALSNTGEFFEGIRCARSARETTK